MHDHFQQMTALLALDARRTSLRHQFAGHHHPQPIALLGFFQIVRRHQDRRAGVGQLINHVPESAPRQRVHDIQVAQDFLLVRDGHTKAGDGELFRQPEEIAHAVAFLASSDAAYITGQVLCVDGGMVM